MWNHHPISFGYFDIILDKYCLFAVFNQSFKCIGLCFSEVSGPNLFPHLAYHHQGHNKFGAKTTVGFLFSPEKNLQFCSSEPEGRNFKFDAMVFFKRDISWAKNCGTILMLWHWKAMGSLGEKWLQVSNSDQEKVCEFCSSKAEGRNFNFDGIAFCKRYIGSPKNCGTSFILWPRKAMESLVEKWLLVSN